MVPTGVEIGVVGDSILSTPQLRIYLKSKLRLHNLAICAVTIR